jgi:hypothetical protein
VSLPRTPRLPLALRLSSAPLPPVAPYSSTARVSFRFDLPQNRRVAAHPSRCRPHRDAVAPSLPSPHLIDISGSTPTSPTLCNTSPVETCCLLLWSIVGSPRAPRRCGAGALDGEIGHPRRGGQRRRGTPPGAVASSYLWPAPAGSRPCLPKSPPRQPPGARALHPDGARGSLLPTSGPPPTRSGSPDLLPANVAASTRRWPRPDLPRATVVTSCPAPRGRRPSSPPPGLEVSCCYRNDIDCDRGLRCGVLSSRFAALLHLESSGADSFGLLLLLQNRS